MAGELDVSVLGPVRARLDGEELPLGGRRQRAVLARLALAGGRAVAIDRMVDQLWDGDPPASVLNTLQSYVSNLRRVLGADVIVRAGDGYRLDRVSLAAVDFEQAVAAATSTGVAPATTVELLDDALARWHGAALGDLADEPWAVGDAVRLTELRLAALEERAAAALELGRHAIVAPELDVLAREHPLRERMTALLVVALYRCGRQADALRAHERLRAHLAEELGLDPSPELARLAARVLDHDPTLGWTGPTPELGGDLAPLGARNPRTSQDEVDLSTLVLPLPPAVEERRARSAFVGRTAELDALGRRWADVEAGGRLIVLVEGEPGAGKTRVAQQLARHVHERGGNVLWGRCTAENLLAYQPIVEALRTGARALPPEQAAALARARPPIATLLPDVSGVGPTVRAERWDLFEAVVDMFGETTATVPTLIVIDDLHWADPSTLALLDHLVRQGRSARVLVLGTVRRPSGRPTPELDQLVVALRRDDRLATIALAGIGTDEVVALLDGRGVAVSHDDAAALCDRTGGNPFFLEALVEHGSVDVAADARAVPASVRDLLDERLQALGDEALRVLSAAAVIGARVDLAILGPVVGLGTDALLDVVDAAVASRLLVEDEELGWVGFPHALVRSALIARTTRNREARHHLRTADVVDARPDHLDREATVAQHLLAAGRLAPPVRTADACVAAGRRALTGISDEDGRAWAERALAVLDTAGVDDADVRRARGEALLLMCWACRMTADYEAWPRVVAEAVALVQAPDVEPHVLVDVAGEAAMASSAQDYPWTLRAVDPAAMDLVHRALAVIPEDSPRRALILSWGAIAAAGSVDHAQAVAWSDQVVAGVPDSIDAPAVLSQLGLARRQTRATPAGLDDRLAAHPLVMVDGNTDYGLMLSGKGFSSADLLEAGDVAGADRLRDDMRATAAANPRPWYDAYVLFADAAPAFLRGDVERGEALLREGMALGVPSHVGPGSQFDLALQVMSARARGREGDLLPLAERITAERPDLLLGPALRARALLARGATDADADAGAVDLDLDLVPGQVDDLRGYLVLDLLAEVAWLTGRADLGRVVADTVAPYADRIGTMGHGSVTTGPVHRAHGLALAAAGDLEAADAALARAVAVGAEHGWRPTVGRASLERAAVLSRLGRPADAEQCRSVGESALAGTPVAPLGDLG